MTGNANTVNSTGLTPIRINKGLIITSYLRAIVHVIAL